MKNLFGPTNRIALLHFGRAGSILIAILIQQNGNFFYDGEFFEKVRVGGIKVEEEMRLDRGLLIKHRCEMFRFQIYLISQKPIPEEHLRAG